MSDKIYAISWWDIPEENRKQIWHTADAMFPTTLRPDRVKKWMLLQGAEKVSSRDWNNKKMYIFESQERYVEFTLKWM